jgi:hypothetical protein
VEGDAGADAADAAVEPPFSPPDIPWLDADEPPIEPVTLTPCPDGWREVADGDLVVCDPYPESGVASCDPGEEHFPGEPGCAPVGDPCPAGEFPADLPSENVVYVRAGATGGDGSLASPYGSLSEVDWVSLGAGETLALAKGTYGGSVPLRAGARVVGACAAETILTGADPAVNAVVTVTSRGDPAIVENVTIRDPPQSGCIALGGFSLRLDGVVVEGAGPFGIGASAGASIDATHVVVRGTRRAPGTRSTGVYSGGGAAVTIDRAVISDSAEDGVIADDVGSVVTLTNAATRRNGSFGLAAIRGATASVERAIFEGEGDAAVFTREESQVSLRDVVIRDTTLGRTGMEGRAVLVASGAHVEIARSTLERNQIVTIDVDGAFGDGPSATLNDVVIRDTRAIDGYGRGISAQVGGRVEGSRVAFVRNGGESAVALGDAAEIMLTDVVVRDGEGSPTELSGARGLSAALGGHLDVSGAIIERAQDFAVFAAGVGSRLTMTDVRIRDTEPRPNDGKFGVAIGVQEGASLEATRVVATEQWDLGAYASHDSTTLTLTDAIIGGTRSQEASGRFGHGVQLQYGATGTLTRVRVEDSRGAGVMVTSEATAILNAVSVVEVTPWACVEDGSCTMTTFGYGLAVAGSTLSARDFLISGAENCGVFVAEDGQVDLSTGEITGSQVGACVQVDAYDVSRLQEMVVYRDNGANLDATSLPVPSPFGEP